MRAERNTGSKDAELITEFITKWEEGYENVYMIVTKRTDAGWIRSFNSRAFYWLAGKLTENRIPRNASDFRLVDRKVYETVRQLDERNRFVRGLFAPIKGTVNRVMYRDTTALKYSHIKRYLSTADHYFS